MNRHDYTPLNIIEKKNSRLSMLFGIFFLVFMTVAFQFLDYLLVRKPAMDEAAKEERALGDVFRTSGPTVS